MGTGGALRRGLMERLLETLREVFFVWSLSCSSIRCSPSCC